MALDLIDLVVVPGLGFSESGHRIGRGMGFYDRFLAQPDFNGIACGLAFSDQVVEDMPVPVMVLDHASRMLACSPAWAASYGGMLPLDRETAVAIGRAILGETVQIALPQQQRGLAMPA